MINQIFVNYYKSFVNLEINKPNSFTVFAGSNGAGKSNIFESLEFASYKFKLSNIEQVESLFGGANHFLNYNRKEQSYTIQIEFEGFRGYISYSKKGDTLPGVYATNYYNDLSGIEDEIIKKGFANVIKQQQQFLKNFTRLFIGKSDLNRVKDTSNKKLLPDASNLSAVLKNVLSNADIREEFLDWMQLFIPGFENIEIHSDIDGASKFLIYEKGTQKPFDRNLISDGTYNILVLLTAVYQSQEPQFLCIEEPENGLNPYVIRSLVDFFRKQCDEKGHYIWLNTHSPVLVKELLPRELILVDKENGTTKIKQFSKEFDLYGLTLDEAWLSNALGGGIPW